MVLNQKEKKAIEILDTFELRRKTKNYKEISLEDTQNSSRILTQLILIGILLHWRKLMQIQNDCLCRMREKKLKKIQL